MKVPIQLTVRTDDGPRTVDAWRIADGLAIHRVVTPGGQGDAWAVSHEGTGIVVLWGFTTEEGAGGCAMFLGQAVDWSIDISQQVDHRAYTAAVMTALKMWPEAQVLRPDQRDALAKAMERRRN